MTYHIHVADKTGGRPFSELHQGLCWKRCHACLFTGLKRRLVYRNGSHRPMTADWPIQKASNAQLGTVVDEEELTRRSNFPVATVVAS